MQEQERKNINSALSSFGFQELPPRWVEENRQQNIHRGLSRCLAFQELPPRWELEATEKWTATLPSLEAQIKDCLSKPIEEELREKLSETLAIVSTGEPPNPEEIVVIASDRQIYREEDVRNIIYARENRGFVGILPQTDLLFYNDKPLLLPHYAFQKLVASVAQEILTVGDLIPLISCPITKRIFQDPVVAMNGWTHEASVLHALSEIEGSPMISIHLAQRFALKQLGLSDEEIRSLQDSGRSYYPLCIRTPQIKALIDLLLENFPILTSLQFPKNVPIDDINVSAIEHLSSPAPARDYHSYVKPVLLSLGNLGLLLCSSFLISECNRITYSNPGALTSRAKVLHFKQQLAPFDACKQAFENWAQEIYPKYFGILPRNNFIFQMVLPLLLNFLPPSPGDLGPLIAYFMLFILMPIRHMPHVFFSYDSLFEGKHCDALLEEEGYQSESMKLMMSYHSMLPKAVLLGVIGGIAFANVLLSRWSSRLLFPKKNTLDEAIKQLKQPPDPVLYKRAESKAILFAHKYPDSKIEEVIDAHFKCDT